MHKVFVYGTLLQGERNYWHLENQKFLGVKETTDDFNLIGLGACPAMIPGSRVVKGELYEVDDKTLAALDELESHPTGYTRTWIYLASGERVFTYIIFHANFQAYPLIESGDWRTVVRIIRMKKEI